MITTKTTMNTQGAKGFSLLELLLVVAVGAVLILAGLGAYRLVSENNNTNQATRQLVTLKQQVQQTFAGQAGYPATANLLTNMDALRAIPADMPTIGLAAGTLRGALGTVTLTNATAGAATFSLAMTAVPRSACVKLGQVFTPANATDLRSLTVGTTAVTAANFTQAGLLTACSAATQNMTWVFN